MAKKKRGGKKPRENRGDGDMLKNEHILQAVLLADSFRVCFRPLTLDRPKVLLPLVNVPMINYTLEFLDASGVKEVFVLASAHTDQIQKHIKASIYNRTMKIHVISCENSYSEGDALRHIDAMRVLKSDFVLIGGDVVSNINLEHVLELHKQRRKQDKLNIMTVVMKRADPLHRTRGHDERAIVVLNSDTKQLVLFDNDHEEHSTQIELSLISEHPKVEFRHDLMDTHIYVCGLEVLDLLTENFDWQDIQRHLIKGIVEDFVLGNKIHSHLISGDYAARVQDPKSYHSISKDVIQRWTYPLVPEYNLFTNSTYQVYRNNIYKERNVHVDRSSRIICNTVIGSGSKIYSDCVLDGCILGQNVTIQKGCVLKHCYIWDGCKIGAGVKIIGSIVGNDAEVGEGTEIKQNCIVGSGVRIADGSKVPEFSRLAREIKVDEDEEDIVQLIAEGMTKARQITGRTSILYTAAMEDMVDKYEYYSQFAKDAPRWSTEENEVEFSDDDEWDGKDDGLDQDMTSSEGYERFEKEMVATLHRGMENKLDVEAIVLEAGSLKLTHHALLQDYYAAAFLAFFSLAKPQPMEGKKPERETLKSLMALIKIWKSVLAKFASDVADQKLQLVGLTKCCQRHPEYLELFSYIINLLYQWDLVEEDAALDWEDEMRKANTEENDKVLKRAEDFLTYLKEASEEEDSDE